MLCRFLCSNQAEKWGKPDSKAGLGRGREEKKIITSDLVHVTTRKRVEEKTVVKLNGKSAYVKVY